MNGTRTAPVLAAEGRDRLDTGSQRSPILRRPRVSRTLAPSRSPLLPRTAVHADSRWTIVPANLMEQRRMALGVAIGAGAGVAVGLATGSLVFWLALGAGVGVAIGALLGRQR